MADLKLITLNGIQTSADTEYGASWTSDKAVDLNASTLWQSTNTSLPHLWKYDFGSGNKKIVKQITLDTFADGNGSLIKDFQFQGSNNDADWDTLITDQHANDGGKETYTVPNTTGYRYYRVYITSNWRVSAFVLLAGIEEIEMFEDLIAETVTLEDAWDVFTNPEIANINESVTLDDSWFTEVNPQSISINETVNLSDSWNAFVLEQIDFGTKIISINPLIIVTDTNPAKIHSVDISDPENPIWVSATLVGVSNAQDVSYNETTGFLYIACASGKVVKVDATSLSTQTIIDLSDTDDLQTIDTFDNESLTYTSTDASLGELYMIDEREASLLDTDFQFLQENITQLDIDFEFIEAKLLDTDFQFLGTIDTQINTDFKWTHIFQPIPPETETAPFIGRSDYVVKINGSDLTGDDLVLDSVVVTHTIGEKDEATFRLARYHDSLNQTKNGASSIITSQNSVQVYISGNLEFSGNVSKINCVFEADEEHIAITAKGQQQTESRQNVTMSLPSKTSQLSIYDVLIQNPVINNPIIDPDDENPEFFKGITVDLGTKIQQSISRFRFFGNTQGLADSVTDGSFNPKQNWSYFWFASARNFLTKAVFATLRYIGTSIGSLTGDTWEIDRLSYRRQRTFDDIVTELGDYEVGEAPFQEVSTRNGILIPDDKYEDKPDGLYLSKDEGYNFEDYAKQVADLEFEKIQTINGAVAPKTSVTISLSHDAYYFYALRLLTRININNTTEANVYKNNNGFPVSIKSITLSSSSMQVSLSTDNLKSDVELQEIDDRYPDEDSDEFNFEATSRRQFTKFDPNTLGTIE